jgi:hypothetical protein
MNNSILEIFLNQKKKKHKKRKENVLNFELKWNTIIEKTQ